MHSIPARAARLTAVLVALFPVGCKTVNPPDLPLREAYHAGNYEAALEAATALREEYGDKDRVYALQEGIVQFALGRPKDAIRALRAARDADVEADLYDQGFFDKAFSNTKASLSDDRALPYAMRDYEQLMMYSMLSLGELLVGGVDEVPFAFQGREKLLESIAAYEDRDGNNPKAGYRIVSFGDYVYAAFREEDPTRTNDALRAYERFFALEPAFPYGETDIKRLKGETDRRAGDGVLYVFTLVGRGPEFGETILDSSAAQIIALADVIWNLMQREGSVPILQDIVIPALRLREGNPTQVAVSLDGDAVGSTVTVTDLDACAQAEFEAMYDTLLARAVTRRIVKTVAKEVGKEATGASGLWSLVIDIFANLWAAAEKADLRCWSLLPSKVQVLRVELPEGDYQLGLQPELGVTPGALVTVPVTIEAGYHTYVLGIHPDLQSTVAPISSSATP